jgi:hypothetical protein
MLIHRNSNGTEDFRELATGDAAEKVHLPETVLGHDVALGFGHVGKRRCANVGDAPGIAIDGDLMLQARQSSGAVNLRKRPEKEPPCKTAADKDDKSQKPADDAERYSQQVSSKKS